MFTSTSLSHRSSQTIYRASTTPGIRWRSSPPPMLNIDLQKHPIRGGRNLRERYRRLENSLRGKQNLSRLLEDMPRPSTGVRSETSMVTQSGRDTGNLFRGFKIPTKPNPPGSDECCMSGCAICVHDLYQDSLTAYNDTLASLRFSLSTLRIPESEWPAGICISPENDGDLHRKNVSLSVLEELERALQEKRYRQVDGPT